MPIPEDYVSLVIISELLGSFGDNELSWTLKHLKRSAFIAVFFEITREISWLLIVFRSRVPRWCVALTASLDI